MADEIVFGFARRLVAGEVEGPDRDRLRALASLRTGAPIDRAGAGLPLGVSTDEEIEVWHGEGDAWSGDAWVTSSGDVVVFPADAAAASNYTMQGGFERDDDVSAATRSHACRGADCWGCAIEQA